MPSQRIQVSQVSISLPILNLILGVHRSGTSLLTHGLMAAGALVGDFVDYGDLDNPNGYAEHPAVCAFNNRLLAHLGASWDNWGFRAGSVDWDNSDLAPWRDEGAAILREAFHGPGPFVLKDPRCATLAPFWERVVPQAGFSLRRIIIVRDPAEVAESQRQRVARRPHEFPVIADAEPMAALWTVTMMECLTALSDDATLLVGHAGLRSDPAATLAAAARFAGLSPEPEILARFAAEGVRPELHRAGMTPDEAAASGDVWMRAARSLYADLVEGGLPRPLPAAEARALVEGQTKAAALLPGLPAVRASIARMQQVDATRRARLDALTKFIWPLSALSSHVAAKSLAQAVASAEELAESSDLPVSSFAFAFAYARLLVHSGQQSKALAWLDRIRPQFGHFDAFVQLETRLRDGLFKTSDTTATAPDR